MNEQLKHFSVKTIEKYIFPFLFKMEHLFEYVWV